MARFGLLTLLMLGCALGSTVVELNEVDNSSLVDLRCLAAMALHASIGSCDEDEALSTCLPSCADSCLHEEETAARRRLSSLI
jgi:hypothetical protein